MLQANENKLNAKLFARGQSCLMGNSCSNCCGDNILKEFLSQKTGNKLSGYPHQFHVRNDPIQVRNHSLSSGSATAIHLHFSWQDHRRIQLIRYSNPKTLKFDLDRHSLDGGSGTKNCYSLWWEKRAKYRGGVASSCHGNSCTLCYCHRSVGRTDWRGNIQTDSTLLVHFIFARFHQVFLTFQPTLDISICVAIHPVSTCPLQT